MGTRLTATQPEDLPRLKALYIEAFPPEERRPWQSVITPGGNGPYLRAIKGSDGTLLGMLFYWDFDDFVYIEHFAIAGNMRGKGSGSAILQEFIHAAGKPAVLEVEPPSESNPLAIRRIDFYRRNGLDIISTDYIQPPYEPGGPFVPLFLMATDTTLDAVSTAATLHSKVYGAD